MRERQKDCRDNCRVNLPATHHYYDALSIIAAGSGTHFSPPVATKFPDGFSLVRRTQVAANERFSLGNGTTIVAKFFAFRWVVFVSPGVRW
jgi:hypothetical protein